MILRAEVLDLFTAQHLVASAQQLYELGMSKSTLIRARQRGVTSTVIPGIERLNVGPLTFATRAMALQLHAGPDSYVSGFSAGVFHGLRQMPRRVVEVTVPEMQRYVMPPWGRLHRSSWVDQERDVVHREGGLRIASALRTLFRLAGVFNQHRFQRAAEDCWHLQLVTPDDAAVYLATVRRQGRTGVRAFEHWLEHTVFRTRPSQSGLELDVLEAILRAGLPVPTRQHPLQLRSGATVHLDLAWPTARLAVEPGHTWWHGGDAGMARDEARRRACGEVGWHVIPCTEHVRDDLAGFGLQLRIIHDERVASLRTA